MQCSGAKNGIGCQVLLTYCSIIVCLNTCWHMWVKILQQQVRRIFVV